MQEAAQIFGVFKRRYLPEAYEGIRIGLVIAEQIIRRHGGQT